MTDTSDFGTEEAWFHVRMLTVGYRSAGAWPSPEAVSSSTTSTNRVAYHSPTGQLTRQVPQRASTHAGSIVRWRLARGSIGQMNDMANSNALRRGPGRMPLVASPRGTAGGLRFVMRIVSVEAPNAEETYFRCQLAVIGASAGWGVVRPWSSRSGATRAPGGYIRKGSK